MSLKKIIDYVLKNTDRDKSGRLIMPLTWNNKNKHLLSENYLLATKLLESNLTKLKTNEEKLKLHNDIVFKKE